MWLLDPHGYFEEYSTVSFLYGFLAVFLHGGFTLLTTLFTLIWIAQSDDRFLRLVLENIGVLRLMSALSVAFIAWIGISLVFYILIAVFGSRISFYETVSICGIGFVPIAIASFSEFAITAYYIYNRPPATNEITTNILLSGHFGIFPQGVVILSYLLMFFWAGRVWIEVLNKKGKVSKVIAAIVSTGAIFALMVELVSYTLV